MGPSGASPPRAWTSFGRSGRSHTNSLSRTRQLTLPCDSPSPVSGRARAIRRTSSQPAMRPKVLARPLPSAGKLVGVGHGVQGKARRTAVTDYTQTLDDHGVLGS